MNLENAPGFRVSRWMLIFSTATLAIITASPLVWMVSASLKEPGEIFNSSLIPRYPTLENFRYVFTQLPFLRYILNTFFVAGTITIIALLFHSMAGYAFARLRFPGRETIFLTIFSTFLVSLQVIIVPLFILVQKMGMVNSYAGRSRPRVLNDFEQLTIWKQRSTGSACHLGICRFYLQRKRDRSVPRISMAAKAEPGWQLKGPDRFLRVS